MAVSVSGAKLNALGVDKLYFGPPANASLSEEQLSTLQEGCTGLSKLFDDDSLTESEFETIKKSLAEAGIQQLLVGIAEDLETEKLTLVQNMAVELFNELGLSISPLNE